MQPYFLPYIGYWQLMHAADKFIVYDNIQYTKKGWINRNRFLLNGKDELFSIPLKSDSDYLNVIDRSISPDFNRKKLLNKLSAAYKKSPQYNDVFPIIERMVLHEEENLFRYIHHSLVTVKDYLNIQTPIVSASDILINHDLKSQDKVIALCNSQAADLYINPIGGITLYDRKSFINNGISLGFLRCNDIVYPQFKNVFVPSLSILDVIMFNSRSAVIEYLDQYSIES